MAETLGFLQLTPNIRTIQIMKSRQLPHQLHAEGGIMRVDPSGEMLTLGADNKTTVGTASMVRTPDYLQHSEEFPR